MLHLRSTAILLAALMAAACTQKKTVIVDPGVVTSRVIEIEVEVYDPVTNGVWENVGVRVVQAWNEWNNCTCVSPVDEYILTDEFGLVYFAPEDLDYYDVGFAIDGHDRAILGPDTHNDEAWIVLEVYAPGFTPILVDVDLSWDQPYAFVSVPFE